MRVSRLIRNQVAKRENLRRSKWIRPSLEGSIIKKILWKTSKFVRTSLKALLVWELSLSPVVLVQFYRTISRTVWTLCHNLIALVYHINRPKLPISKWHVMCRHKQDTTSPSHKSERLRAYISNWRRIKEKGKRFSMLWFWPPSICERFWWLSRP